MVALGEANTIRVELLPEETGEIEGYSKQISGTILKIEGISIKAIELNIIKSGNKLLLSIRYRHVSGL